ERAPRIRRLAVAGVLGAARYGDRIQARSLSPRTDRARALHGCATEDASRAPVRIPAPGDARFLRQPGGARRNLGSAGRTPAAPIAKSWSAFAATGCCRAFSREESTLWLRPRGCAALNVRSRSG